MDKSTLERIKTECEKIEKSSGHGQVIVKIQDGTVHLIQHTENVLILRLDKSAGKV